MKSLLSFLLAASPSPARENGVFWSGQVVAAFVAAGVALVGALVSVIVQLRMSRRQQAHDSKIAERQQAHETKLENIARSFSMRQREIDWRLRQLNELYGPIRMLRATSKRLRQSLPSTEQNGERWRLVRHILEAKANPGYRMVVEAILSINATIADLLSNKAGLMEGPDIPESFERFMQHSRLLQLAWDQGDRITNEPGLVDVSNVPFPDEIDDDVSSAIGAIQAALREARLNADLI